MKASLGLKEEDEPDGGNPCSSKSIFFHPVYQVNEAKPAREGLLPHTIALDRPLIELSIGSQQRPK